MAARAYQWESAGVLNSLSDLASASPWTYAVVFGFAVLDAIILIVPSETVLVAAAALAGSGDLMLSGVIAAAGAGALIGDTSAYSAGRWFGPALRRRFANGRLEERLSWAGRQLDERGSTIILVARFIPGGRTATMLTAGTVRMRWRRFLAVDALAATIWACYGGLIGYIGGAAFEEETWKSLALALGLAFFLGVAIEVGRRLVRRRRATGADLPRNGVAPQPPTSQ
jgi:membrane-associated protein